MRSCRNGTTGRSRAGHDFGKLSNWRSLGQAVDRERIGTLLADADFDGEWVHEHVRCYGIRTLIPPERGRPSEKPPAGRWRRRMKQRFNKKKYVLILQTETVNSMIKPRLGSAL